MRLQYECKTEGQEASKAENLEWTTIKSGTFLQTSMAWHVWHIGSENFKDIFFLSWQSLLQKKSHEVRPIRKATLLKSRGTSLLVQWLRLWAPNRSGPGFNPWSGNWIPHATTKRPTCCSWDMAQPNERNKNKFKTKGKQSQGSESYLEDLMGLVQPRSCCASELGFHRPVLLSATEFALLPTLLQGNRPYFPISSSCLLQPHRFSVCVPFSRWCTRSQSKNNHIYIGRYSEWISGQASNYNRTHPILLNI